MRSKLKTLTLSGLLSFFATAAVLAQAPMSPPTAAQAEAAATQATGDTEQGNPADTQLQSLTSQLDLTPDQQTQIKALLVANQQKLQAVAQAGTLSAADRRKQAMSITQATTTSIKALLTPDQRNKFDAL